MTRQQYEKVKMMIKSKDRDMVLLGYSILSPELYCDIEFVQRTFDHDYRQLTSWSEVSCAYVMGNEVLLQPKDSYRGSFTYYRIGVLCSAAPGNIRVKIFEEPTNSWTTEKIYHIKDTVTWKPSSDSSE